MGLNQEYPVLDGVAPSWADITVKAAASGGALIEMVDIASITSGRTVEVGVVKGASGGRDRKRTTGAISQECSWTLYREGYQKLLRALMAQAPARGNQKAISMVTFGIQILHTPFGSSEIFERRIKGARIIGDSFSHAEGTDADQVEVPMSCIEIVDIIDGVECVLL